MTFNDNCVILDLSFSEYGHDKKIPKAMIDIGRTQAPESSVQDQSNAKTRIKASKRILDDPRITAIHNHNAETREHVRSFYTLPDPILRPGMYRVPIGLLKEADTYMKQRDSEREALVEVAVAGLPEIILSDEAVLGPVGAFNRAEYPTAGQLRAEYEMTVKWRKFSVPSDALDDIDPALRAQAEEEFLDEIKQAQVDAVALLREQFALLVSRMQSALEPQADGKKRKFYSSNLENVLAFLKTFPGRNVLQDDQLAECVAQTQALLEGTDVNAFRKSDALRAHMAQKISAVAATLATLTEPQERSVSFIDETAELAA